MLRENMDGYQKLKRFAENADETEIAKKLTRDPCAGCPSVKTCKFIQKGKVCSGIAKEWLDQEIAKMERQRQRESNAHKR